MVGAINALKEALAEKAELVPIGCEFEWSCSGPICAKCGQGADIHNPQPIAVIVDDGFSVGFRRLTSYPPERGTILYAAPISVEAAVISEREACYQKLIKMSEGVPHEYFEIAAAAIRARGEA